MAGCKTGHLPDPNDPADGPLTPSIVSKQVEALNIGLHDRWQKGEFDEAEYKRLLRRGAAEILSRAKVEEMDTSDVWMYGDLLRTAEQWPMAEKALRIAVKHAEQVHDEDRRINDTLRLAQVEAKLGNFDEAIRLVKSTLDAAPKDSVPILMGTLYEVVPAAKGHGKDLELAALLESTISTFQKAVVDPNSEAGKAFLVARPMHIRRAWAQVIELYAGLGRQDLAEQALTRARSGASGAPPMANL